MAEFLNGGGLIAAVKRVLEGENVRCAVAFWGEGAAEFLSGDGARRKSARIVCDLRMGCTSPRALRKLGAPKNDRLREHDHLHAKVYLSDAGVVIGSANMSGNALGFGGKARHREAAMFLGPNEDGFQEAADWFDALFDGSKKVNSKALKSAEDMHRPGPAMIDRSLVRKGSLLDLVLSDPGIFASIGFLFTDEKDSPSDIRNAKKELLKTKSLETVEVEDWPEDRIIAKWERRDVELWPSSIIEYFRPVGGLTLLFHNLHYRTISGEYRSVFTVDGLDLITKSIERPRLTAENVAKADDLLAARLLGSYGRKLYGSAHELRNDILDLDEEP